MNIELYREALGFAIDKGFTQAQAEEYAREASIRKADADEVR